MIFDRHILLILLVLCAVKAWTTHAPSRSTASRQMLVGTKKHHALVTLGASEQVELPDIEFESEEQKKTLIGNLVADDEWDGLTMELADLVRKSCTYIDHMVEIVVGLPFVV